MYFRGRLAAAALLLFGLAACSESHDHPRGSRSYQAYGETWTYTAVDRHEKRWGLMTSHGLIGQVERDKQLLWLQAEGGEKFDAGSRYRRPAEGRVVPTGRMLRPRPPPGRGL